MSNKNQITVLKKSNNQEMVVHIKHYFEYTDAFKPLTETEQAKVDAWVKDNGRVELRTQVTQEKAGADSKLADEHEKATKKAAPKVAPKGD